MVHLGFQHSGNCISQHRYFSRMACDLAPSCNFLYGVLSYHLPEDTIDVELTVRMLKGIHSYRKDCSTQISSCSPWSLQVCPFLSLTKKMEVYLEERRNNEDPFCLAHTYPNRPVITPFENSQITKGKKAKNLKKRTRTDSQKV